MSAHFPDKPLEVVINAVYHKGPATLLVKHYFADDECTEPGREAIVLMVSDGQPLAFITTNMPEFDLLEGEMICKTYSENEGMVESLIEGCVLVDTGKKVDNGYVTCPICRFHESVLDNGRT